MLLLKDPKLHPTIVPAIIPSIGPAAHLECRRWGGEFLSEVFGNPLVSPENKEAISLSVVQLLRQLIETPNQDAQVVKSVVQVAASVYPFIFKWIISNSFDTQRWDDMMAIKTKIYSIWDTAPIGIRVCCIKFAQKLVLLQTPAPEASDARPKNLFDVSASMVPADHPLIPHDRLGAEAAAILDRMLAVFHDNATDAVLINATLNALAVLIRARPSLSKTCINAIMNFNPLKLANSPMTPKTRVMAKSMEKTLRSLLNHLVRRDPNHPLAAKMDAYAKRLERQKQEIFDRPDNKRGPPEPTDGLDDAKRQKLNANVAVVKPRLIVPPLTPAKNHTAKELYTITDDAGLQAFDVGMLPADLVLKIVVSILPKIDSDLLKQATDGVLARYNAMMAPPPPQPPVNPSTAPLGVDVDEDGDEYDPEYEKAEDTEQILNKLDNAPPEPSADREPERASEQAITAFHLQAPQVLSPTHIAEKARSIIQKLFDKNAQNMQNAEKKESDEKPGFNRLAAVVDDDLDFIDVIQRLATRTSVGLMAKEDAMIKHEYGNTPRLSDECREKLLVYVLDDFRRRTQQAIAWLCEEYLNDQIALDMHANPEQKYDEWAIRILDGMLPYLDSKDKFLARFCGEIPYLPDGFIQRIKDLCINPDMIPLAVTTLLYVASMKPPSRERAVDALEQVWTDYEEARPLAEKCLNRFRPEFMQNKRAEANNQMDVDSSSFAHRSAHDSNGTGNGAKA